MLSYKPFGRPFALLSVFFAAALLATVFFLRADQEIVPTGGGSPGGTSDPPTCSNVSQDGETTIEARIDDPLPGDSVRTFEPCIESTPVSGIASTLGLDKTFDLYFVLDSSGSTDEASGTDVDGDGNIGTGDPSSDPGDSILAAEVEAVRRFISELTPAFSKVAIIQFSNPEGFFGIGERQRVVQQLTNNYQDANDALDEILAGGPAGATDYGGGLDLVFAESNARHTPGSDEFVMFMTDGVPTFPQSPYTTEDPLDTDAAINGANTAAARDIVINTYAVGDNVTSDTLERMAEITGGEHFEDDPPGNILDTLPETNLAGIDSVLIFNTTTGEWIEADVTAEGRFTGDLPIILGLNDILVRAIADNGEATSTECITDITNSCLILVCPEDDTYHCQIINDVGTWVDGLVATSNDPDVDITNNSPHDNSAPIGDEDASGNYPLGTTLIGFSAFDEESGEQAFCTTRVTVEDVIAPGIFCPSEVVVECAGPDGAYADGVIAGANDLCTDVVVVNDSPFDDTAPQGDADASGFYPLGDTTVIFTATDEFNNSRTCETVVRIVDTTLPTIVCPDDQLKECDGPTGNQFDDLIATATDLCHPVTVINLSEFDDTPPQGDADASGRYPVGPYTIRFEAHDEAGNIAVCHTVVTALDSTPPDPECPDDPMKECTGPGGAFVEPLTASATDLCSDFIIENNSPFDESFPFGDEDASGTYPIGTTRVTFVVTDLFFDGNRNGACCTADVSVVDTVPPDLSSPDRVAAECTGPNGAPIVIDAAAGDLCSTPTVTNNSPFDESGPIGDDDASGVYPLGSTPVIFRATDDAGNRAFRVSIVEVEDTVAPIITCPAPMQLQADDNCAADAPFGPQVADLCDPDPELTRRPNGPYRLGTTDVIFLASDTWGNAAECPTAVTVVDETPPTVDCSLEPYTPPSDDTGDDIDDDSGDDDQNDNSDDDSDDGLGNDVSEFFRALFEGADNCDAPCCSATINGIPVSSGQLLRLIGSSGFENNGFEYAGGDDGADDANDNAADADDTLTPVGPFFTLTVTCVDQSGNSVTCDQTVELFSDDDTDDGGGL